MLSGLDPPLLFPSSQTFVAFISDLILVKSTLFVTFNPSYFTSYVEFFFPVIFPSFSSASFTVYVILFPSLSYSLKSPNVAVIVVVPFSLSSTVSVAFSGNETDLLVSTSFAYNFNVILSGLEPPLLFPSSHTFVAFTSDLILVKSTLFVTFNPSYFTSYVEYLFPDIFPSCSSASFTVYVISPSLSYLFNLPNDAVIVVVPFSLSSIISVPSFGNVIDLFVSTLFAYNFNVILSGLDSPLLFPSSHTFVAITSFFNSSSSYLILFSIIYPLTIFPEGIDS